MEPLEQHPETGKVSTWLLIGIIFLPIIFVWFTRKKGYSNSVRILSFGWLFLLLLIGLYDHGSKTATPVAALTAQSNSSETETTSEDKWLIDEEIAMIKLTIMLQHREVQDIAIRKEDERVSIVAIVSHSTSVEEGKRIGDNLTRMVKAHSPDHPPGKEIGKGIYDYIVGIILPNSEYLILGAKVSFSRQINW